MESNTVQHGIDGNSNNDAEKGAVLGGVGGALAGVAAGAMAGPLGAMAGAAIGGVVGAGASGVAVGAVDEVDNDNSLSGMGQVPHEVSAIQHTNEHNNSESGPGASKMRRGSSLTGLKVISLADGTELGKVRDLIFDHDTDELAALLLSDKDLFGLIEAQIVPWSQVHSLGHDAIVVQSTASKIKAGDEPHIKRLLNRKTVLSGTKVYTTDGQDLGTFADLYIDDLTGYIVGYEVSGGFVSDTLSGKTFLPAPQAVEFGQDVALVPPQVAHDIEQRKQEQPAGLQGAAATAGDKLSGAAQAMGATVSGATATVSDKVQDMAADAAVTAKQHAREAAMGKPAGHEVTAPDGSTIVAPGMTITATILEQARGYDKEDEVLAAAGAGAATQGAESAKAGAANVWDTIKEKATSLTGAAHQKKAEYEQEAEAAKIRDALGRPVSRVILDPSDKVILNTGELITHAAVEQARAAGELEVLLDSVYMAEPEITPEMLRAQQTGQAALPS